MDSRPERNAFIYLYEKVMKMAPPPEGRLIFIGTPAPLHPPVYPIYLQVFKEQKATSFQMSGSLLARRLLSLSAETLISANKWL